MSKWLASVSSALAPAGTLASTGPSYASRVRSAEKALRDAPLPAGFGVSAPYTSVAERNLDADMAQVERAAARSSLVTAAWTSAASVPILIAFWLVMASVLWPSAAGVLLIPGLFAVAVANLSVHRVARHAHRRRDARYADWAKRSTRPVRLPGRIVAAHDLVANAPDRLRALDAPIEVINSVESRGRAMDRLVEQYQVTADRDFTAGRIFRSAAEVDVIVALAHERHIALDTVADLGLAAEAMSQEIEAARRIAARDLFDLD